MLPTYVRGLKEPLSLGEYAKLEGLDENDVLQGIHALGGVYSLGWYLEAPPYTEERFARLRAEPKLEPRLLNWLQRRADLHDNPQYKSEVERLRVRFIKSDPRFNTLRTADQSALVTTKKSAQVPQPVDYGLSRPDVCVHRGGYPLDDGLKYREGESHEWRRIFLTALVVYICFFGAGVFLNNSGWLKAAGTDLWKLAIGAVPVSLIGGMMFFSMTEGLVDASRRRRSNPGYLRYKEALGLHALYQRATQAAVREAEQAMSRKKRSYWSFLDGYSFESATADVLNKHQFNARVTQGSGDGGVDIEVTRNGLRGVVQCKAHMARVGPAVVRDLYGVIHHTRASFGIIVSLGGFSNGALEFARDKPILFVNLDDLIAMQEGKDVLATAFAPDNAHPEVEQP